MLSLVLSFVSCINPYVILCLILYLITQAIFSDHVTELQGDVTSTGRFGFALSVLSDIDQDGFNGRSVD